MKKLKKVLITSGVFLGVNITLVALLILTGKQLEDVKDFDDAQGDYDDEKFYDLTHNENGNLNEYGKSLGS